MYMQYTAVIQKNKGWYIAWVEEVPGVNCQAKTLKEVKEHVKEALGMVLEANRKILAKERPKGRATRHRFALTV